MQPKVSMVMPCYNKEAFIGNMFDSILAQKWDNIELILVNDGSTDGTRRIIAEYEAKFQARGFEVVVQDQENQGAPGASYAGLKLVTGDYVCLLDADDELDPEYVSAMAGWLAEHPDCDWAACDMLFNGIEHMSYFRVPVKMRDVKANMIEHYIFGRICKNAVPYMVRREYMMRSGVLDDYFCGLRHSQEPQFVLPMMFSGGKCKHIPMPLYRYMPNDTSQSMAPDSIHVHHLFFATVEETLKRLPIERKKLNRLLTLTRLSCYKSMFNQARSSGLSDVLKLRGIYKEALEFTCSVFVPSPCCTEEDIHIAPHILFAAIADHIFSVPPQRFVPPRGRIIAWGALGRRGKRTLPILRGTPMEPTELWDMSGDGAEVKMPDIKSLTEDDLVLILPIREAGEEIWAIIKEAGCAALKSEDILLYARPILFPQFYDGSLKFIPRSM